MPCITPPDHHLIPIQRPLPQAHKVGTTRVQEIVARVTATLRSSGSSPSCGFCKRLESAPGHRASMVPAQTLVQATLVPGSVLNPGPLQC